MFPQEQIGKKMMETIARDGKKSDLNYVILMTSKAKLFQRDAGKQFIEP